MESFNRTPPGFIDEYKSPRLIEHKRDPFYVRITTDFWSSDDCLYVEVPAEFGEKSIADVLNYVFPQDAQALDAILASLDTDEDPSLPERHQYFRDVRKDEEKQVRVLDYSANLGEVHLSLDDTVNDHCALSTEDGGESAKVLHLIVEQYMTPFLEYNDADELASDKAQFRGMFFHYMVSNQGLSTITKAQYTGVIKEAVDYCKKENLISLKDDPKDPLKLLIEETAQGAKHVQQNLLPENDWYAENYEIFARVLFDDDEPEFLEHDEEDNPHELDLRFIVMRKDIEEDFPGLNPYRYNMLMNLFNNTFEEVKDRWDRELKDPKFFARYLHMASVRDTHLTTSQLELVREIGKEINEENNG